MYSRPPFLSGSLGLSKGSHAKNPKEVIPMRCQGLSRSHPLLIVPLTLLVFSAGLTWTQERPSASKTPTQSSNLAAPFVAVPEAKIRFQPAYENLSLPFTANQGQTPSQVRFSTGETGYHSSPTRSNALPELWQLKKIDEPQVKANHFLGNAPTKWLTGVIPHNTVHYRTPDPGATWPITATASHGLAGSF